MNKICVIYLLTGQKIAVKQDYEVVENEIMSKGSDCIPFNYFGDGEPVCVNRCNITHIENVPEDMIKKKDTPSLLIPRGH